MIENSYVARNYSSDYVNDASHQIRYPRMRLFNRKHPCEITCFTDTCTHMPLIGANDRETEVQRQRYRDIDK